MYRWLVFVHVVGVFGFLLTHGASVLVTFTIRRERNPERLSALLDLSARSITAFYVSILVLLAGGIAAGFVGRWWGQAWIWTALVLLVATMGAMYAIAMPYFRKLRATLSSTKPAAATELERLQSLRVPELLTVIGFGSLLVILWLMMFKPF